MKKSLSILSLCLIAFSLSFAAVDAAAKPQIVAWEWPTQDCDGGTLAQSDFIASVLIYDVSPMPMSSDNVDDCAAAEEVNPPAGATVVTVDVTSTSIILNLRPGQTYFARMRVSAGSSDLRSHWSREKQFTVPYGRPQRIIIADGVLRHTSFLITDPVIRLN